MLIPANLKRGRREKEKTILKEEKGGGLKNRDHLGYKTKIK